MNKKVKQDIRELSSEELISFFIANNEKPFRAKQVNEWLWKKAARSFAEMTNISLNTRELLTSNFDFKTLQVHSTLQSSDGTVKTAFQTFDGHIIEGVLIPTDDRITACISSQVGCAMGCTFCATGFMGYKRNLSFLEIFDQVTILSAHAHAKYAKNLSNIVYMGMGEPLMNYKNIMKSINLITSPEMLNISPTRITLSTVGLPKMVRQLADDHVKVNLAISLHTAWSIKRDVIVPINKSNSLDELSNALKYFFTSTGTRISIEYLLLDNFNDSIDDAKKLAEFCRAFPCKVNIIEYNEVKGLPYKRAGQNRLKEFADFLQSKNMVVNIRKSRGKDINAACGQLAGNINQS